MAIEEFWTLTPDRLRELDNYIDDWYTWFPERVVDEVAEKRLNQIPVTLEEIQMYFWMGYQRAKFARWMNRWLARVRKDNVEKT